MLKRKYVLHSLAALLVFWQVAGTDTVNSGIIDGGKCSVRSGFLLVANPPASGGAITDCNTVYTNQAAVVLACPLGDGDPLTSAVGAINAQISLTVRDNACVTIEGIPAEDMWLIGCNDGLLLCGGSEGTQADHETGDGTPYASGETTFSHAPKVGGCDTGVYVVCQGIIVAGGSGPIVCLPVQVRSIDYKSAGPTPPPCGGDIRCPDGKVTNADFSWFVTHYPTGANPGATYFACADYAAPLGSPIGLADFSKFAVHFAGAGHKCP